MNLDKRIRAAAIAAGLAITALAGNTQATETTLPGAVDQEGRQVLTFIGKEPPGTRCNNNLQVAARVANTYQVPIRILSASMVEGAPAPAVFYGDQLIAADGADHNGMASYQIIADILELEGVARHDSPGKLDRDETVSRKFSELINAIKSGN